MANEFFNHDTPLAPLSRARSSDINTLMSAVAAGFDKLPTENEMKFGSNLTGIDSGSANNYAITLPHTPSALVPGSRVWFIATHSNTGASVLDLNGLGAVSLTRLNGQPLQANDINAGQAVCAAYTGTVWNLVLTSVPDVAKKASDETISGNWNFTQPVDLKNSRQRLSTLDGNNEVWFRYSADDSDLAFGIRRVGANNYQMLVKIAGVTQVLTTSAGVTLANDAAHGNRGGGALHSNATSVAAGFMSAADKAKLDAIEAGATADLTASEILALLLSVDGSGSGLDADLLDGQDSSFYRNASNMNAGTMPAARLPSADTINRGGVILADQSVANALADASRPITPATLGPLLAGKANTSGTYSGLTAGKASTLAQNGGGGAGMTFNWSGQGGQPSWLWGGNDGVNHYVYNPSNFNVAYAASAGNADTVDGYHASQLWRADQAGASFAGSGYQILPSGLIIQWGLTAVLSLDVAYNISFPLAFPNACHSVVLTLSGGYNDNIFNVNARTASYFTVTLINLLGGGGNAGAGSWIAIGY